MSEEKTLMQAIEEILEEDSRTRDSKYSWTFFVKVLQRLGFKCYIEFQNSEGRKAPSPETLFRERREILNKRNKYPKSFEPEEGVTFEKPKKSNSHSVANGVIGS